MIKIPQIDALPWFIQEKIYQNVHKHTMKKVLDDVISLTRPMTTRYLDNGISKGEYITYHLDYSNLGVTGRFREYRVNYIHSIDRRKLLINRELYLRNDFYYY